MKRWLYDLIYRFVPTDWIFRPSSEIKKYVDQAWPRDVLGAWWRDKELGVQQGRLHFAEYLMVIREGRLRRFGTRARATH